MEIDTLQRSHVLRGVGGRLPCCSLGYVRCRTHRNTFQGKLVPTRYVLSKQPAAYRESSEKWVKDMMACQRHVVCQAASIPGNLLPARLHVTFGLCYSYVSGVLHKVIRTYVSMSSILCISFRWWLGGRWWWRMAMIQKRLQCQLVSFPSQFPDGHRTIIHR